MSSKADSEQQGRQLVSSPANHARIVEPPAHLARIQPARVRIPRVHPEIGFLGREDGWHYHQKRPLALGPLGSVGDTGSASWLGIPADKLIGAENFGGHGQVVGHLDCDQVSFERQAAGTEVHDCLQARQRVNSRRRP